MKTCKNPFYAPLLVAGLLSITAGQASAHTFTTLYHLTGDNGGDPRAGLVLSSNVFYGTTWSGNTNGNGTVFKINKDGTGFTVLHSFSGVDGAGPYELILSGTTLYGSTGGGGSNGLGTIYRINIDGTGFTNLHHFSAHSGVGLTNEDGWTPTSLVLLEDMLYGATSGGGVYGVGTIYSLNTDGSGFRLLHTFTEPGTGLKTLIPAGDTLYGTSSEGGVEGTVFALKTNGTGYATLYSFTGLDTNNNDGIAPYAPLVLSGSTLYGTASGGGSAGNGNGTVFKLNTNGDGFATLHSFSPLSADTNLLFGLFPPLTNSDGAGPESSLVLSGSTLYGTAVAGGKWDGGTVFSVNTDGTCFTTLHNFTGLYEWNTSYTENNGGYWPIGKLVLSGNTLYGTTSSGTIFSLSLTPLLTIAAGEESVVLTWPTNYAGFDYSGFTLQSTTDFVSGVWTTNLPAPVIVNGQYTLTNPMSGTQQFFRLSQ